MHDDGIEIEPANGGNLHRAQFWRNISLWLIAFGIGAFISWLAWITAFVFQIRQEQVTNTKAISDHEKSIYSILNTGVDDRFRRSDFNKEKEIMDIRFRTLERQCENCCDRPRLGNK